MTAEKPGDDSENILIRFGNGAISFIVGLFALFVINVTFMTPIRLVTTQSNAGTFQIIQFILFWIAVYLAFKYTKHLNANGTRKSRNIKRTITVLLGFVCVVAFGMFLSFYTPNVSNSAIDANNAAKKGDSSIKPVIAVTVIEESVEGATSEDLNQASLEIIANALKEKALANMEIQYRENGYDPRAIDLKQEAEYHFVVIQGLRLGVINTVSMDQLISVIVVGIIDGEFIRVSCMRTSNHKISLASGVCADEMYSAFGVRVLN